METRDRDKLSKSTGSTPAGDVNRHTSSRSGQQKSGSSADFGQKVGRGENIESEQGNRRSGSIGSGGMQGDSGRSSGSSNIGDVDQGELNKKSNRGSGGSSDESL
jgi:hypothetical protein